MPDEKRSLYTDNCLLGGISGGCTGPFTCEHCGFNPAEAERRKRLPLYLCADGLARVFVARKKKPRPVKELPG